MSRNVRNQSKFTRIEWELYMGARRYGISLRVVNAIAHEWEQEKSEVSGWTVEEKFHFYKQPCIVLFVI